VICSLFYDAVAATIYVLSNYETVCVQWT